jgi:hypothetical protein
MRAFYYNLRQKNCPAAKNNWVGKKSQKYMVANRKSANCNISGRFANLKENFSPQICGFGICGTNLRIRYWLESSIIAKVC